MYGLKYHFRKSRCRLDFDKLRSAVTSHYKVSTHQRFPIYAVLRDFSRFTQKAATRISRSSESEDNDDFTSLLNSKTFIDKSQFIRIVADYPFVTVAAPPKFGKSTHLLMMKKFFELSFDKETLEPINNLVNKNGAEIKNFGNISLENVEEKEELTENFKFFKSLNIYNEDVDEKQEFMKNRNFYLQNCARYPVIFMNFKEINPWSPESFKASLQTMIQRIFRDHSYLLNSQKLLRPEKALCELILDPDKHTKWDNWSPIRLSLQNLTKFLSIHFGRPCVVLIDDLDRLIDRLLNRSRRIEVDLQSLQLNLGTMLSRLLINNSNVQYGIMTVRKLLPWTISHHLDHFESISIMRDEFYCDFFAVNEAELNDLLCKHSIKNADLENLRMIKSHLDEWDDGCDFWWDEDDARRRNDIRNRKLYSFTSVEQCLRNNRETDVTL